MLQPVIGTNRPQYYYTRIVKKEELINGYRVFFVNKQANIGLIQAITSLNRLLAAVFDDWRNTLF